MRPIDADALEEIVQGGIKDNPHKDGFARVCHRTEYTHFLDVIRRMPTIAPPPNDPLTLEELREMDGEPVRVTRVGYQSRWALVYVFSKRENIIRLTFDNGSQPIAKTLLDGCKIYRRKPEECESVGD